nr:hypothetical protein CFP56_52600 [Quercus suber]
MLPFPFAIALLVVYMLILQPDQLHGREYDVRVVNGFTNNDSLPLVIWCASKDSDLGGRALQEHDDFSWRLRTNLWGTTHFLCTMKWDQKRKSFDAFKVPRDIYRCGPLRKCSWLRPLDLIGNTNEDGDDIIALAETGDCEIAGDLDEDLFDEIVVEDLLMRTSQSSSARLSPPGISQSSS